MTKLSSSDTRDITIAWPSIAMKKPASVPTSVERERYVPITATSATATMPATAVLIRQPAGSSGPSAHMPRPISHLPSGGWATKEGAAR
jgi:hypothetical protein